MSEPNINSNPKEESAFDSVLKMCGLTISIEVSNSTKLLFFKYSSHLSPTPFLFLIFVLQIFFFLLSYILLRVKGRGGGTKMVA